MLTPLVGFSSSCILEKIAKKPKNNKSRESTGTEWETLSDWETLCRHQSQGKSVFEQYRVTVAISEPALSVEIVMTNRSQLCVSEWALQGSAKWKMISNKLWCYVSEIKLPVKHGRGSRDFILPPLLKPTETEKWPGFKQNYRTPCQTTLAVWGGEGGWGPDPRAQAKHQFAKWQISKINPTSSAGLQVSL